MDSQFVLSRSSDEEPTLFMVLRPFGAGLNVFIQEVVDFVDLRTLEEIVDFCRRF